VAWDGQANRALVVTREALFSVDVTTGERLILSDGGTGSGPTLFNIQGVTRDPATNRILVVIDDPDALLSIDPDTGDRTVVSDFFTGAGPKFEQPTDVTWDAVGNRAIVIDRLLHAIMSVNLDTGEREIMNSAGTALFDLQSVAWNQAADTIMVADSVRDALFVFDLGSADEVLVSK
jgi:hypothetical protein